MTTRQSIAESPKHYSRFLSLSGVLWSKLSGSTSCTRVAPASAPVLRSRRSTLMGRHPDAFREAN